MRLALVDVELGGFAGCFQPREGLLAPLERYVCVSRAVVDLDWGVDSVEKRHRGNVVPKLRAGRRRAVPFKNLRAGW